MYLKIIDFNAMDFSERRSEEVMFLLTLSVCWNMLYGNKK